MFRYAYKRHLPSAQNQRRFSTPSSVRSLDRLKHLDIEHFRQEYFKPSVPVLLPKGDFAGLPAISQWFVGRESVPKLNDAHFRKFEGTAVPVELYRPAQDDGPATFQRADTSLELFMDMLKASQSDKATHIYLAQCPLVDLPGELQAEVPTPELVTSAGRGDVYDSSIWLGQAPTFTPLHKDPNPNLLVQLCGPKVVRLLKPSEGEAMIHHVRRVTSHSGMSSSMRGEEMMVGTERDLLEKLVWGPQDRGTNMLEGELQPGDGLFIPKGWWHSIKGVGVGMNGSVNWWFR